MVGGQGPVQTGWLGAEIDAEIFPCDAAFRSGLAGGAKTQQNECEQSPMAQDFVLQRKQDVLAYKDFCKY